MSDSGSEPMVVYDFDPRNLPPEYLQAMGLVLAAASQTESILQDFIGGLLKIDNLETRALTAHMSMPLKDNIARAVTELNAPSASELDLVDDLLDDVFDAMQKRNAVAHNAFCIHPQTGEILTWREHARGSLRGTLRPITSKEIEDDAALIYDAGMRLQSFMIMRDISPTVHNKPMREYLKRSPEARTKRRGLHGGTY